jgi:ATP synthase protein I
MPFSNPIPDSKPRSKVTAGVDALVHAEKLMQIAILLPSAAFIGWLAGAWADSRLHTKWIGLAGIVFGGISGLVYVIRLVMHTVRDSKYEPADDAKSGGGTGKGNSEL